MAKRRGKKLSTEDKDLWDRVARSTTPMHAKPAIQARIQAKSDPEPARDAMPVPERMPAFRIGERADTAMPTPTGTARPHAPLRMDAATHKKMARGKLKPEGRIDLHGKTLAEAHPALTSFILSAHSAGKRLVLVITGKGKDRDTDGPIPIRRGVLRHQVPHWLHAPPLGALILEVREAHQRHGGHGAYYVYLRRPR